MLVRPPFTPNGSSAWGLLRFIWRGWCGSCLALWLPYFSSGGGYPQWLVALGAPALYLGVTPATRKILYCTRLNHGFVCMRGGRWSFVSERCATVPDGGFLRGRIGILPLKRKCEFTSRAAGLSNRFCLIRPMFSLIPSGL